jgi:hypothetical protein
LHSRKAMMLVLGSPDPVIVTTVPGSMHVPGSAVIDSLPEVAVTEVAEQGCVVVVDVGMVVVVVVVVVVVGFFLFAAAASGTVLADTVTPVPTRTAPAKRAPMPNFPSRRATNLELFTVSS